MFRNHLSNLLTYLDQTFCKHLFQQCQISLLIHLMSDKKTKMQIMNRINFVNLLFKVILTLKMLMNLMMVRIITNERTGDERTEGQRNETKIIENLNLVIFEYCYSSPLHNKYLLNDPSHLCNDFSYFDHF